MKNKAQNETVSHNKNAIAFWKTKANPITMFESINLSPEKWQKAEKLYKKTDNIEENFVALKDIKKELKISVPRIHDYAERLGEYPKKSSIGLVYKKEIINDIRNLLSEEIKHEKVNIEDYISNPELMKMFDLKPFKAWEIARKHKLVKKTFNMNIAYYERKKAIEIFSQYKKN